MKKMVFLTIAAALATGCVSSDFMSIGDRTYPPRPDDWVIDVYVGEDAPVRVQKSVARQISTREIPEGSYAIGRVDVSGAPLASWGKMVENAKRRARTLGGDAVVVGSWGSPLSHVGAYGTAYHGKAIGLTVIRYPDGYRPRTAVDDGGQ